jgi:signal transduction histidine kinase
MARPGTPLIARYLVAVLAVGAAHLLTLLLWPVMEGNLSLLFITAVMVSALHGGLGPGLVASFLGALASAFFHLPPRYSFDISFDDLLRLVVFVAVAGFVSWLNGSRRRSEEALREAQAVLERRVLERTAELSSTNQELKSEVAERRKAEERAVAYQARLQSLAAELSATEERQRRGIATTLHDAVGHRLAVAVMKLRGLLEEGANGHAAPHITRACELIEQSIQYTRSLTLQLSPPILHEMGLSPALEWLAEQVQQETGLLVSVVDDGQPKPTDEQIRPLLFNSARELLVNVVKHARAHAARMAIERDGAFVRLVVADDGIGCDGASALAASTSGFGLFNIRERLAHLGGAFELGSEPGGGCRVTLTAPLTADTPEARAT